MEGLEEMGRAGEGLEAGKVGVGMGRAETGKEVAQVELRWMG